MSEAIYCPNEKCSNLIPFSSLKTACPECGYLPKYFSPKKAGQLIKMKEMIKKINEQKNQERKKQEIYSSLIFSDEITDSQLKKLILEDMEKLETHYKRTDSALGKINDLLTGATSDKILRTGFLALIYQNSILIKQNELILRALSKANP